MQILLLFSGFNPLLRSHRPGSTAHVPHTSHPFCWTTPINISNMSHVKKKEVSTRLLIPHSNPMTISTPVLKLLLSRSPTVYALPRLPSLSFSHLMSQQCLMLLNTRSLKPSLLLLALWCHTLLVFVLPHCCCVPLPRLRASPLSNSTRTIPLSDLIQWHRFKCLLYANGSQN